ncbi:MAG: hypothetical protein RI955_1190 [Bacteroidota bacterium]
MKLKSFLAKPYASYVARQIKRDRENAVEHQDLIFKSLIKKAANTIFGKQFKFSEIKTYQDFISNVPLFDYEDLKPFIEQIKEGKQHVLWPGKPIYLAKSSGTTSGIKYLPITKDSISNHIDTAKNALLIYMHETGNTQFADGRMIFLSGSPELERVGGIPTGRLSGIVNHHIPYYLRKNQLPSYTTNCIEDWEQKLQLICDETINENMTLISGIPPWTQMYFDELEKRSDKKIGELFSKFSVMVYGGVNFEPYRQKLFESIGKRIDTIETYPASEGFIAFQDSQEEPGLLLNTNAGIFYEFVLPNDIQNKDAKRISLKDVEVGVNYAIVLNTNAGLFGYVIGDTIKFVSTNPYRIVVTGRIKHFISAFGEHVIAEEVEKALMQTALENNVRIVEFTVAPQVSPAEGLPYHEWLIEFDNQPTDLQKFAEAVDTKMRKLNIYYDDLITGNILKTLVITPLQKNAFINYMKSIGKLGGQNKVPRLSNDRKIADELANFKH